MIEPDLESLCKQLAMKGGAHIHTANKARFYISRIDGKPKAGFSNCSRAEFLEAVRGALYREEWSSLSTLMNRWW